MDKNTISLNPLAIARVLGSISVFLIFASIGGQISKFMFGHDSIKGLVPLFDLNDERNIPTFFSLLLMIFASILLFVISLLNRKQKSPHTSKWTILSMGFIYMAYDEAFQVHELLIVPIRNLLGSYNYGIFYYAWVVPAIAVVFALSFYFFPFLWHLTAKNRRDFSLSAILYLGGCICFELIGGQYHKLHGSNNFTFNIITTIEETLEMSGLIYFIYALLTHILDNYDELRFLSSKTT